jgi:hypothetical protein
VVKCGRPNQNYDTCHGGNYHPQIVCLSLGFSHYMSQQSDMIWFWYVPPIPISKQWFAQLTTRSVSVFVVMKHTRTLNHLPIMRCWPTELRNKRDGAKSAACGQQSARILTTCFAAEFRNEELLRATKENQALFPTTDFHFFAVKAPSFLLCKSTGLSGQSTSRCPSYSFINYYVAHITHYYPIFQSPTCHESATPPLHHQSALSSSCLACPQSLRWGRSMRDLNFLNSWAAPSFYTKREVTWLTCR